MSMQEQAKREGKVRLLLIGAGNLANKVHYPNLRELDDVELTALCDIDPARLKQTADTFGIGKRYTDYRDMLANEQADAIFILMPPIYHFDMVMASLARKLHVFVEKPPAVTSFQMETFVREAARHGVFGMVGFNRRHIPMVRHALAVLERHGAEEATQIVATFYKRRGAVFFNGAMDALTADGIHAVDFLRFIAGSGQNVEELFGVTARYSDEMDNAWNALMRFSNGATGILQTNYQVGGRLHTFEIHAPDISLYLNPDEELKIVRDGQIETLHTKEIAGSDEFRKYYGFYDEARHFIDCIRHNTTPSPDFADALETMKLVERIKRGR